MNPLTADAIEVGDVTISGRDVYEQVQQEVQRYSATGAQLTLQQAQQFGIVDAVVNRLIEDNLFAMEIRALGLTVSDGQISRAIRQMHTFATKENTDGSKEFDRDRFKQYLASQGYSEHAYIQLIREQLVRQQLFQALLPNVEVPEPLTTLKDVFINEQRDFKIVTIRTADFAVSEPTAEQINQTYEQNKARFMTPEVRASQFIVLNFKESLDSFTLNEDDLRAAYDDRIDQFTTPKRYKLTQVIADSQDKADAIYAAIQEGSDFAKAVSDAGLTSAVKDLGAVRPDSLLPELEEVVPSIAVGEASAPVKTDFGWHILQVKGTLPQDVKSFESVKDELAGIVREQLAADQFFETVSAIEADVFDTSDLEAVASAYGLKVQEFPSSTRDNYFKAFDAKIAEEVFTVEAGDITPMIETDEGNFFVFKAVDVVPSQPQSLEDVRTRVVALAKQTQRFEKARDLAQRFAAVESVSDFNALASKSQVNTSSINNLKRKDEASGDVPQALIQDLFAASLSGVAQAQNNEGYVVGIVSDITRPNVAGKNAPISQETRTLLSGDMSNEILIAYRESLRHKYDVDVNQAVVDRLFESR